LFFYETEICVWFEHFGNISDASEQGGDHTSNASSATCGHPSDVLPGGVPLHGLTPGNYALRVTLSLSSLHQQSNGNLSQDLRAHNPDTSPSLWRLADLTRTFTIVETSSEVPATAETKEATWDLNDDTPSHLMDSHTTGKLQGPSDTSIARQMSRVPKLPSTKCGSFVDDSEWCIYRPACLDTATLGLVLLAGESNSQGTPFQLGRKDDSSFIPTSLDRSLWTGLGTSSNDLPHRSSALTRHLSAASFADAEKRGAVAWFDPTSDDDHFLNDFSSPNIKRSRGTGDGSDLSEMRNKRTGRIGLMFESSWKNVYHAATKALQLSYAAKDNPVQRRKGRGSTLLDAVVPLSCTEDKCQPAHATHNNAPAAAWLDGLLSLLFSNATTQVIHDPRAWASAIHEKTSPTTTNKSPVELMCFQEVVIPGESRALFRGPADARRFRFNARRYLGLSPVVMHPPPKVIVTLFSSGNKSKRRLLRRCC
jgi:hypothetical protein